MKRTCLCVFSLAAVLVVANSQTLRAAPDFPPFKDIAKDFRKIISTPDGSSLYSIWVRDRDGSMLAELPPNFTRQKYFFAMTVASGERFAGLQVNDIYVQWRRYDRRLALIQPNLRVRSTGDQESKKSIQRLFTDRVILDVPIVTMGPRGGPVIDMKALLVGQAPRFFGFLARGINPRLSTVKSAKAFPQNVELAFEVPMFGGVLKTLHYSISVIPDRTGYQPRKADSRVGYFTTTHQDLGNFSAKETWVRYINRWKLEKRDPSLKLSPPKEPIVFYVEHTTPVRYRRWVRRGILLWNKAFEKVGISDAIEVRYQDGASGDHMEKDPEDVRYNFVRWLNNGIGVAIGPSRVHPATGQILDADIILTDGWIRSFARDFREKLPEVATEGLSPDTLAWLNRNPKWHPRFLFSPPSERTRVAAELLKTAAHSHGGHPLAAVDSEMLGDDEFDGLVGRVSQVNGMCLAANGKGFDLDLLRMSLELMEFEVGGLEAKDDEALLDGVPEEFIGPLVADLVAHEVGHTLGLRHNFKASSVYALEEINSDKVKGKPFAGSVMDYNPVNINVESGEAQGDYGMVDIGPYDMWAIEYGYSQTNNLKPILDRVAEPALAYATDEDTFGPDPLARRYDLGSNPLEYARNQMRLAKHHRERIVEKFVKEGESWARARRGYQMTLIMQIRAISIMSEWIGGSHIHRDKKGDKDGRPPVSVVDAKKQRDALEFILENAFKDEAFGLSPELLQHMTIDKWLDEGGYRDAFQDATWPVHDRVRAIQGAALTMIMNPTTLRRVYDNELRTPPDEDMLTLPDLLTSIADVVWNEFDGEPKKEHTDRKPWISSLRRNLQREHLERLIDLSMPDASLGAAEKPISNLAMQALRNIETKISSRFADSDKIDRYSLAHMSEAKLRINKALDADYIYNTDDIGGGGFPFFFLFKEPGEAPTAAPQGN